MVFQTQLSDFKTALLSTTQGHNSVISQSLANSQGGQAGVVGPIWKYPCCCKHGTYGAQIPGF